MLSLPQVLKEKPLDEFAVAVGKSRSVARSIVPEYEVSEDVTGSNFFLWQMDTDILLARSQTVVAPYASPLRLSWKIGTDTGAKTIDVVMREHAIAAPVPEQAVAAAIGLSPRQWAVDYCIQQIVNSIDGEFAELLKTPANFTGGTKSAAAWETNATSLQSQIATGKLAVKLKVDKTPDTLICGPTAYEHLPSWMSIDGSVDGIEQARNKLNISRLYEMGRSDGSAFYYDGEAVLIVKRSGGAGIRPYAFGVFHITLDKF